MRRQSARLRQKAQSLADTLPDLTACEGPEANAAITVIAAWLRILQATASNLDEAGAVLQRYATELAEGHELGRRAERRVEGAGLLLEGTRVVEPWGPASAQDAADRLARVPGVQARVDLATAHVGRARGRLQREAMRLTESFSSNSRAAHSPRPAPSARRLS